MAYTTDSDGNFFTNSTLDDSGASFVNDLPGCLTAALGSGNYGVQLPSAVSANTMANAANMRIEWRPQGVGETLSGTITLNTPSNPLYDNQSGTRAMLSANARFGMRPFNGNSGYHGQLPMRDASGNHVNVFPWAQSASGESGSGTPRVYATITQQEVIFLLTNTTYSQFILGYQGVVQNIPFPFSGSFPKGCVGFQIANMFGTLQQDGHSFWTDNSRRGLRMASNTLACTSASGLTFGTNLWMTDFPLRFDASENNNAIIGIPKNLKLAIGTSVTPGTLYTPSTPIDSGSNFWLCVANYPTFTNGKLMLRVKT